MKKVLFFIATAVLLFASCTQEKLENPATDEVTVSFSAEVPGAALTRAYGAAESVNILTYFVYDSGQTTLICKDTAPVNGGVAHVHLTLVKGKSYDILFWAQSSEADAYTVSEDQTLKVDYGKLSSNDDANDAFYAFRTFDITGPINESVHLLRPFAQINLGTNDPDNADKNYFPAASRMTATLPDVLNLKSNETSGEVVVRTYAKSEIEEGEFPISDYKYLAMNYVLVGNAPTITDLVFNLYKNLDDENPNNTIIVSNAPIQQNYRTNIYGALLSDDADFEIEVDSDFGGTEDNMNLSEVSTELELANALANGGEIKLLADITTEKAYQLNKTTTLNLNGSTLTYNGDDIFFRVNGAVTRASEGTSLTVKGAGAINSGDYIFLVNEGGKLYLDADATYVGETTIVNVNGGEAYISAGDFSVSNPVGGTNEAKYLLDHVDDQKGNGLIEVTGGTFHGFNPEESYSEDPAMNFLAEGYSTKVCGIDQAGYTVYEVISVQDLSSGGTANSYIVSESGTYRFPATHKGNEAEPSIDKASIASAEVLWESFGTSAAPTAKDLISEVSYNANDGLVTFSATDKKGNALIAVKDSEGTILWSWHIWMTDAPQDQVYRNNAGIMMDRNLGATSATPGDGMLTHGLVYQWGRKDPFIMRNYNGDDNTDLMKSVGAEWPDSKVLKLDGVTEEEAVKNPMQLYSRTNNPYNWLEELDNYRWSAENTKAKTINDPCPAGYQVPYGGPKEGDSAGIWAQALGLGDDEKLGLDMGDYTDANAAYKSNANKGIDFASSDLKYRLMDSGTCWYPACGYLGNLSGKAYEVNSNDDWGNYWGCELEGLIRGTYNFSFGSDGMICLDNHYFRSGALSVRCQKITK